MGLGEGEERDDGWGKFCSFLIKVAETSGEGWQSQTGDWGG